MGGFRRTFAAISQFSADSRYSQLETITDTWFLVCTAARSCFTRGTHALPRISLVLFRMPGKKCMGLIRCLICSVAGCSIDWKLDVGMESLVLINRLELLRLSMLKKCVSLFRPPGSSWVTRSSRKTISTKTTKPSLQFSLHATIIAAS